MKNSLTFTLTVSAILINCAFQTSEAAIEAPKPAADSTKPDTTSAWIVQISPAPGLGSYATRKTSFPVGQRTNLTSSDTSIVIVPRVIPVLPAKPASAISQRRPLNRSVYCNSWPWSRSPYYANLQSNPAQYMYGDLIRSNWFGTPYPGHSFYYSGYRPSFRFGSLQFRGFGNYDRMYNPRIIPFGYQYTGSRTYYAALALTSMLSSIP